MSNSGRNEKDSFLGQLCHLDRRRHRIRRSRGVWQIGVTSSASHKPNSGQSPVEAWSGGLAIHFLQFLRRRFGYGKFNDGGLPLHGSSAVVTFAATPIYNALGRRQHSVLERGRWLFSFGNGTCEAVIIL